MFRALITLAAATLIAGRVSADTVVTPRILIMGDSYFAWNRISGNSIPEVVARELGEPVIDRSTVGAKFHYNLRITGSMGMNISMQYLPGRWDWVVMNGGGNDLLFDCGCGNCDGTLDYLISNDGSRGALPELVKKITLSGARAVFVGYLHSPGVFSIVDGCKDENVEYERRIQKMADRNKKFLFIKVSDLVPNGDRSFHDLDRIHPSRKGSDVVAKLIADVLKRS